MLTMLTLHPWWKTHRFQRKSGALEIDLNLSSRRGGSHQTVSSAAQNRQRESSPRPALHTRFLSSEGTMDGFPDLPVVSPTPLRMMDDL